MYKSAYFFVQSFVSHILLTRIDDVDSLRDFISGLEIIPGCENPSKEVIDATKRVAYRYAPLILDRSNLLHISAFEEQLRACVYAYMDTHAEPSGQEVSDKRSKLVNGGVRAVRKTAVKKKPAEVEYDSVSEPDYDLLMKNI